MRTTSNDYPSSREDTKYYESICRRENEIKPEDLQKLTCFYWHNNHPYLILGPMKAEMFWFAPEIVRFYDMITPSELEAVNRLGKEKSNWATGNLLFISIMNAYFYETKEITVSRYLEARFLTFTHIRSMKF